MGGRPVNDCSGVQELVAPEEQEIKRAAAAPRRNTQVLFQHSCVFKLMHSFERKRFFWLDGEETMFLLIMCEDASTNLTLYRQRVTAGAFHRLSSAVSTNGSRRNDTETFKQIIPVVVNP